MKKDELIVRQKCFHAYLTRKKRKMLYSYITFTLVDKANFVHKPRALVIILYVNCVNLPFY